MSVVGGSGTMIDVYKGVPGVLWGFCVDMVGTFLCNNVQGVFLFVVIDNLPLKKKHSEISLM